MKNKFIITVFEPNTNLNIKQTPNFFIEFIKIKLCDEHKKRKKKKSLFQYE